MLEAEFAKLGGDLQRMRAIIQPYDQEEGAGTWRLRHHYPLMLGETERAVDFYSKALDNREPVALMKALGGAGAHERYPEFFSHPKYQEMLRANGLDPTSISKLNIPPFPF